MKRWWRRFTRSTAKWSRPESGGSPEGLGAAHTLRARPDGEVHITDGPYLESKELIGGITIVETRDLDEALAWAQRGVKAFRMPVEVREIFFNPAPGQA